MSVENFPSPAPLEVRYQIPNLQMYFDLINKARATPKGKTKAKAPIRTGSEWKAFFENSKFIAVGDSLPQATINDMKRGLGVKDERKALTLLAGIINAIAKYELQCDEPECAKFNKQKPLTK